MIGNLGTFDILNIIIVLGIVIAGFCAVVIDDILPCIICMFVVGAFIALDFLLLKAPDVAIAEGVVGAIMMPFIFLITLHKVNQDKKTGEKEE